MAFFKGKSTIKQLTVVTLALFDATIVGFYFTKNVLQLFCMLVPHRIQLGGLFLVSHTACSPATRQITEEDCVTVTGGNKSMTQMRTTHGRQHGQTQNNWERHENGCGSRVEPAYCSGEAAGSPGLHIKVSLGRLLNPKLLPMCWPAPCMAATAIGVPVEWGRKSTEREEPGTISK